MIVVFSLVLFICLFILLLFTYFFSSSNLYLSSFILHKEMGCMFGKENQGYNFLRKNKINSLNLSGMDNQKEKRRLFF